MLVPRHRTLVLSTPQHARSLHLWGIPLLIASLLVAFDMGTGVAWGDPPVPQPSPAATVLIGSSAVQFSPETPPQAGTLIEPSLGTSDFALGLKFQTDETGTQDLGDLVSLWNNQTRHGFTLGVRNNTGATTSLPNWRQLQFGIDAGTEPEWRAEGRPGASIFGCSLAVHRNHLYIGTCEVDGTATGTVYRYHGPDDWRPVGMLDGSNSVMALASFNGELYAGTGKYRTAGSSLSDSTNETRGGKVYRLREDDQWDLIGDLDPTEAIGGFVAYRGQLYASSLYAPAGFYRYEGGTSWTSLPTPDSRRVESLAVHGGFLYAASYDSGSVYRFDGETWQDLGLVDAHITQNYSFTTFENHLHVSTWPTANVYRLNSADQWVDRGRLGNELETMAMLVHNGSFYAGSLPLGEVYRYEGDLSWKKLKQIDETPDVRYRRVWTMATHQGRLFATTLPSGTVWSMTAGQLITDDRELGPGWHDLVAERNAGVLRLFVDGQLAAESDASDLNLETTGLELKVGEGPRGRFAGTIRNLWFEIR